MEELSKSQKARIAIRIFKTMADALALRGYYKPSGKSGETIMEGLKMLSPEIYGSMNDPRIIELKGLEYIIDRLPCGIEDRSCGLNHCLNDLLFPGYLIRRDKSNYISLKSKLRVIFNQPLQEQRPFLFHGYRVHTRYYPYLG